jgi:hypothetical protein
MRGRRNMENDNEKFEEYLSEFEPRKPRALPMVIGRRDWPRRMAAAAAILLAGGLSSWFAIRQVYPPSGENVKNIGEVFSDPKESPIRLTMESLTKVALNDPAQLDAELTDASRRVLPNFRSQESTLRVLAKE